SRHLTGSVTFNAERSRPLHLSRRIGDPTGTVRIPQAKMGTHVDTQKAQLKSESIIWLRQARLNGLVATPRRLPRVRGRTRHSTPRPRNSPSLRPDRAFRTRHQTSPLRES